MKSIFMLWSMMVASLTLNGGGKGGGGTQPMIAPSAPVEEASVEIDDANKKKQKTGKSSLKIPLSTSKNTGLKV